MEFKELVRSCLVIAPSVRPDALLITKVRAGRISPVTRLYPKWGKAKNHGWGVEHSIIARELITLYQPTTVFAVMVSHKPIRVYLRGFNTRR